jgi:hypothetical protein
MSIGDIRERARIMKDTADAQIEKREDKPNQLVLAAAWNDLVVLCGDASTTLGKSTCMSVPTDRQFKNWSTIRFYADGIMAACDLIEAPPSEEIPGR